MLTPYHLGTGAFDITKLFTMLGFERMLNFDRTFAQNEAFLNKGIISVTQKIINDSLHNEIRAAGNKQLIPHYGKEMSKTDIENKYI